jgi:hypothetical protein
VCPIRRKRPDGKSDRERPAHLSDKLLDIHKALGISQNGMIRRMGLLDIIIQANIGTYEIGAIEGITAYTRAANVPGENLIDELELLEKLPDKPKGKRAKGN